MTQRIRQWGSVELLPDANVLPRYLQGGDYALSRINRNKSGGAKSKGGKAKKKIMFPPEGGWK